MLGWFFQLSPCALRAPSWHLVQLRTSCVKTTVEKSVLPILYGVPARTLGRAAPALL